MKRNEVITEETVKFIDENLNPELNEKVLDAVIKATTGESGVGNTRQTLIALAYTVSVFLKMCAEKMPADAPAKAEDFFDPFTDILDFYCFAADHPENDTEGENKSC